MEILQDRVKQVKDYIKKSSKYSFSTFLNENPQYKNGMQTRLEDIVIKCPFHEDFSPSCSLNDKQKYFHCFSCDRGGTYIDFLIYYDNLVQNISISYYSKINKMLQEDTIMQNILGYNSIYSETGLTLSKIRQELKDRVNYKECLNPYPVNYLDLALTFKKRKMNQQAINMLILLMQQGFSVKEIYDNFFDDLKVNKNIEIQTENILDLDKLLS